MDEFYNKIEPQMLLKKSFQKTKNFLHKTPHNLKSFLFGGHGKLPKAARHFNPFSGSKRIFGSKRISNSTVQEIDDLYRDYYQQWHQPDHNEISERKIADKNARKYQGMAEGDPSESQRKISVRFGMKDIERERRKETEKKGREVLTRSASSKGGLTLLQKMEELEMLEGEDLDHVLDVEEVLQCYSLLSSPVYVDIVDRFFMDMYTEFSIRKPSGSVNSSLRKLGPLKL